MAAVWNDTKWARVLSRVFLLALLAYGAYLRAHDLGVSLYDDEINTRERALQSAAYTVETRSYPLYYLAAKLTLQLGDTEAALRLPSFIAGLLSILVAYGLVRQLHSRPAGLVAAALLAFNPFHITHSDFARYYALLMLFTLLTVWSLFLLLERRRWHHWLAYSLSAFLALSSHVCFAPALAMLNVGAAVYLVFQRNAGSLKRRLGRVVVLACCTLLSCSFLIYKDVGPAKYLRALIPVGATPVSADTVADQNPGATVGSLPDTPWMAPTVFETHERRSRGAGADFRNPETGKTFFMLTYYDCLEYLKRYFWSDTLWVWPLLIVVGICGAIDLLYRIPSIGLPLFFGFFVTPIPFFFYQADHWYHPRYFSYAFIFALIFVAIGLSVVPRFLSRLIGAPRSLRLWRRMPEPRPRKTLTVANVLYVLAIAGLAVPAVPIINESYQTYPVHGYLPEGPLKPNQRPERDWQGLYQYVSRTIQKGDQFLFMSPKDQHGERYARYYFSRFLGWPEEEINFGHEFGVPTNESMHAFASNHPNASFWCVGYIKHQFQRHAKLLAAAGCHQIGFYNRNYDNGITLFFLGAPTTNYIANGSFESRLKDELPEGVELDRSVGYNGHTSLRIALPPSEAGENGYGTRYASLPVASASYRLRNNGFEAWTSDQPVGWNTGGASTDIVGLIRPGFNEGTSLRISPAESTTILQQSIAVGLAPGRTMELQMMGASNTPNNLHLVLRYQGPGYQEEVHAVHPGTGKWVLMNLTADIPADADPNGFSLELWRTPGGDGDAYVDDVEFRVLDTGGDLEPGKAHVLSMTVRTEGLRDRRGSDQQPGGRVRLRWRDREGKHGYHDLMEIHDNPDWRQLSTTFIPGADIPLNLESLSVEIGIENGVGTLWADEIQLERGTNPTPFTETFRLPHDEALANIDLAPLESEPAW